MSEKHRKIVLAAAVLIFILFMLAAGWFIGVPMVRLAEDPEAFRIWVDSYGWWGRILFVGMVVLQVLVAFIPGEPVELAAGYAFGFWEGSALTMTGFLIGSWMVFALVRRFGVRLVEVFFPQAQIDQFRFLKNPQKTKIIAFLLMLIPGTPKDFLSYFAGLTKLTTRQWLTIVAVGRIPSLVTSSITGDAAGEENYILSVMMLVITLLISGIGILYYRRLTKLENEQMDQAA
ncbi:MAG: TVP38/TMEM64 family protein [Oscillospiraceae bacterium]|nr:TVP38/TMEM64 family protein [Oscillospiraceae bacterium]